MELCVKDGKKEIRIPLPENIARSKTAWNIALRVLKKEDRVKVAKYVPVICRCIEAVASTDEGEHFSLLTLETGGTLIALNI